MGTLRITQYIYLRVLFLFSIHLFLFSFDGFDGFDDNLQ